MMFLTRALRLAAVIGFGWLVVDRIANPPRAEEKSTASSAPSGTVRPPQTQPTQTRPARTRPAASSEADSQSKPQTFTDDDLKKYHPGGSTQPARKPGAASPGDDPLKTFRDAEERGRWKAARAAQLQQKILDLDAKLKVLEQRRLSIQNPFLPRPQDPESIAQAGSGLSGPELLAKTQEEIRQATQQLEAARNDLAAFLENTAE